MTTTRDGTAVENQGNNEVPDMQGQIAKEVRDVLQEILPGMFSQMKDELRAETAQLIDQKLAVFNGAASSSTTQEKAVNYKDFSACQPPLFEGKKDPIISSRWVIEVEGAFRTCGCSNNVKVNYATNLLRGPAKDWWNLILKLKTDEEINKMTWEAFKELFQKQFVPHVEIERIATELLTMRQKEETVNEITEKFLEKALFCPDLVADEKVKISLFSKVLKPEIREFLVVARCKTFEEVVEVARIRELELESQARKRKFTQHFEQSSKKFKGNAQKSNGQQAAPKSAGEYNKARVCYKCGKEGHLSYQCKSNVQLCFHCHQFGHFKAQCPQLIGNETKTPTPTTMKNVDGKMEVPKAKGRAFQLTAEEARETPDVVTGNYESY